MRIRDRSSDVCSCDLTRTEISNAGGINPRFNINCMASRDVPLDATAAKGFRAGGMLASLSSLIRRWRGCLLRWDIGKHAFRQPKSPYRSEEHTSELQ